MAAIIAAKSTFRSRTFSTPTPVNNSCGNHLTAAIECAREKASEPGLQIVFGRVSWFGKRVGFCPEQLSPPREKQMSFQQAPL
jgi:hypothetical protein